MTTTNDMTRLPLNLPLRCQCGRVRGIAHEVSPAAGLRFVCYCNDCQAFARFLKRPDVLDPAGGTDIFQMPPARLKLTAGAEAVRCLRLSDNGVLRWYADCCRTPIGNTAARPGFPVVGLVHSFLGLGPSGPSKDDVLGLPLCRIYACSAVQALPPDAPPPPSLGVLFRRSFKLLGWWIGGLAQPSPLFDSRSKAPLAAPRVLTGAERAALRAA
jgi:Family of unknown function (DUF6151)